MTIPRSNTHRLLEIDALRGVAALAVVLFHFTTRFSELYHPNTAPLVSVAHGHYGVNLFFIISGFVIFMTLEKTKRPMDFVVSRFSRLFPAYWAAIFLTFTLTHLLGLPGKLVEFSSALANMLMLHGLFRVPHVDEVYWTLEVELLFYLGMLLLYRLRQLHSIQYVLLALLSLRLLYFFLAQGWGIDLPWLIYKLLLLKHIPWFALGISIFLASSQRRAGGRRWPGFTAAYAIATLLIVDSVFVGTLGMAFAAAVWLAANGKLPLFRSRLFVWLGAISYPLYLLHENIGWSIQLQLLALGLELNSAILFTLIFSLALATALTRWVEQPAMRWIRNRYRAAGKS